MKTELKDVEDYLLGQGNQVAPIHQEWADELKPGRSMRLLFPESAQKNSSDLRLEIRFETHRGLKHSYTKMVDRIK